MEAMTKDKKIQGMNLSFAKTVAYGGDGMNQEWEDEMSKFFEKSSGFVWTDERLWNDRNGRSGMYKQS